MPPDAVLRAVGSALLVAVACAAGWAALSRATASGVPWVVLVAGAAVGGTARLAANGRGPWIRAAAVLAFLVFLGLGEALLYRSALPARLEAMHAAEGAADPRGLAEREREATDFWQYLQVEAGVGWLLAVAAGAWIAARIPRLPPAVAVFVPASPSPEPPGPAGPGPDPAPAAEPVSAPAPPGSP